MACISDFIVRKTATVRETIAVMTPSWMATLVVNHLAKKEIICPSMLAKKTARAGKLRNLETLDIIGANKVGIAIIHPQLDTGLG
jgi:hypothetical protein